MQRHPGNPNLLATAAGLALLGLASAARAQGAAEPAASASAPVIETVTVTAQGRAQALQDVPISVKTFSAKEIEKSGITSTQDFINLTPNVAFDQSFTFANSFVTIRGVSQLNNADSPVAVVVDGVPQNNQKQLKMDLFDVQRIEVLKGPQGALFGRNAIGGAITIETKQPTNTLEGFAGVEAGNGATFTESAGISGPIIADKVLFRIAGESKSSDGLIKNTYLDQDVDKIGHDDSLRGKILVYATDDLKLDFRLSGNNYAGGATWDSVVKSGNANDIEAPRSDILGRTEGHGTDFSFKASYGLDAGTLTAITSYTDLVEKYRGDLDFSNPVDSPGGFLGLGIQAGQGQDLSVKMTSQEIRFTSVDEKPFRWIAGTLFLNTKRNLETRAFVDTDGSGDQYNDPTKNLIDRNEHNDNNAWSVFGQVEQDFSPTTTLAAGLRWDSDERDQHDVIDSTQQKKTFSAVQPKLTLTQHFTRDVIGYGTFSTGFRSGGFNAPGLGDFKAERLSNFEAGVKSTLLDKRLLLNASVYYADSRDFQYFFTNVATGAQFIDNIDKVHIKGLDLDFTWLPAGGLQIDGGVGTTDSRIRADAADPTVVGNYTPKASPYKVNLGVQYSSALGGNLAGYARFDVEERSRRYWQINNADVEKAMTLLNLRAGLSTPKEVWSGYVFVKNLTDHRYYADYNPAAYSGLGYAIGSLAEGRQYGIGGKYRF